MLILCALLVLAAGGYAAHKYSVQLIYEQGYKAGIHGANSKDCPYSWKYQYDAWINGRDKGAKDRVDQILDSPVDLPLSPPTGASAPVSTATRK